MHKKAASRRRRLFERKVLGGLALRELEALACAGLTGLLTLASTWVTAEEASGLQDRAKFRVVLDQSAGDREFDSVSLTVHAASVGDCFDVELVLKTGDFKRLEKSSLKGESGQDLFEGVVIDADFSCSGSEPDACDGFFATSGCGKCFAHGNRVMSLDLEGDCFWLLGFVRVFLTCIDLQFFHLGGAKLVLGDHALDGPL